MMIDVYNNNYIEMKSIPYTITDRESMANFIKDLLNMVYYGNEKICLEEATVIEDEGRVKFDFIDEWSRSE
jgi:hypothetical protein